jgi:5-formyltetrahydrofolate cyclo-ligase
MAHKNIDEVLRLKRRMREEAVSRRANQADTEALSRKIFGQLAALPEYVAARTLMLYLDVRTEVRTQWFVPAAWNDGKRVVVPYCDDGEIELFRLDHFNELAPGTMGVLEPRSDLRHNRERKVEPEQIDLIVTPGLAFDRRGGRLGYGKGYYDKLFYRTRSDATKLAVCFECQIFPEIPLLPHDVRMDMIVTEETVYRA